MKKLFGASETERRIAVFVSASDESAGQAHRDTGDAQRSITVIMYCSRDELVKVQRVLEELGRDRDETVASYLKESVNQMGLGSMSVMAILRQQRVVACGTQGNWRWNLYEGLTVGCFKERIILQVRETQSK